VIPALPCGTFSDSNTPAGAFYVAAFEEGDTPHHVGEYRIETVIRALGRSRPAATMTSRSGASSATGNVHLLLIGLDGEARFGDWQLGCIAVAPVGVE
jgi:hypothetical protein